VSSVILAASRHPERSEGSPPPAV